VTGSRRLSQAIAEGDGISVLVWVRDGEGARAAEQQGAEGLVVRGIGVRQATVLPVLAYGTSPREASDDGADAVVVPADDEEALVELVDEAARLGLECVLKVRDEDDLERALEHVDPEIFLLSAEEAGEA
jgi:hypothetical protein